MQVASSLEGEEICEQLRAVGIKCAVEEMPDPNSLRAVWGGQAPTALMVLVNDSDLDNARAVVRTYESTVSQTHEVSVCESRPLGADPGQIGSGYEAVCDCGWSGPLRDTSDEAFEDARAHSANVVPEIVGAEG